MCRTIRTLFDLQPPATDEEIRAASLQFVRKVSGFHARPGGGRRPGEGAGGRSLTPGVVGGGRRVSLCWHHRSRREKRNKVRD
jgi:hypothetical protein